MTRLKPAKIGFSSVVLAGVALVLSACSTTVPSGMVAQPELRPITVQNATLRSLPPPPRPIAVAVYEFPDLTGQFTETQAGNSSMSTAVTQGGSALLIKALQDAGERRWFTVLDRARLDDTLKERQIVTEMRRIYRGEEEISPDALPPLQHASIILQGGITGYDIYTKTGGVGARYLGIGGDAKWQQDTVTVSLRAVSSNTSEVLASVTVQKSIASVSIQGGIFRYVALDRILEAEAGATANEPKQIAVEQAIEKAVESLIIEGAHIDVWRFADASAGQELIKAYLEEKYDGIVPAAALVAVPPVTPNPQAVVRTVPLPRREPSPAAAAPPDTPPPADPDEIVG